MRQLLINKMCVSLVVFENTDQILDINTCTYVIKYKYKIILYSNTYKNTYLDPTLVIQHNQSMNVFTIYHVTSSVSTWLFYRTTIM